MQPLEDGTSRDASALIAAAQKCGVEPRYRDIFGVEHSAPTDVLGAILQSLGVNPTPKPGGTAGLLPATMVIGQDTRAIPLALAEAEPDQEISLTFHFESGQQAAMKTRIDAGFVPLPAELPLGYHTLEASTVDGRSSTTRLVVCPERMYQPAWLQSGGRAGGIAMSLYGVRSDRNWGCGDFTDLEHVLDWLADDAGASFVALNPLHSIPNRQPYNTSPYLPNSSFYRNFIYLDLERIEEFAACPLAQRMVLSNRFQQEVARLRDAPFVEYEGVSRLKLRFLKLLFRTFLSNRYKMPAGRKSEFRDYVQREGSLLDMYALYCALDESLHKAHPDIWNWRAWPAEFQTPDSPATVEFSKSHWRSVLFYKYIQWQIDLQLARTQAYAKQRGMPIGLYHDLALATDSFGSDLWAHAPFYVKGCRVGSPPDNFSPKGQDWGFPPPSAIHHFEDGYRLFADSIRKNSAHGGALRIDHVMRFFRLYWIPDGMDATQGTYVRDRPEDLLRVLALESVRAQFLVIGEDLGTVPDSMREMLDRLGVLSYRLLYFEQDYSDQGQARRFRAPGEYPRQALVSASTHDLPTLAGYWLSRDIQARRDAGVISEEAFTQGIAERAAEKQKMLDLLHRLNLLPQDFARDVKAEASLGPELHNAIVGFLCSTPCQLMVLNQEDLFKETEQQNLPGTTAEYPNWRHKMKYTVEQLRAGVARPYTEMFRNWLDRTGRGYMK